MADLEWNHRLHGDDLHDLVIFLAERYIVRRGGKLKPVRDFRKRYICPCEPDIYFEIDTKLIKGNKRTAQKGLYVVEVETEATHESLAKKWLQYKESLAGLTDLIVIDIEGMRATGANHHDWMILEILLSERMPI